MNGNMHVYKRDIRLRVKESIDKYVSIIRLMEPKFKEFSELLELMKLVVIGLARYHWMFTSDEHEKLIVTMRREDDYSRNITLIGRQLRLYASNPELLLRQKEFLQRADYVLCRCLEEALELYEQSERYLVRMGAKIQMTVSEGYGEHERGEAALWPFQAAFHKRQLDPSRGSEKAIIYPPGGFENWGWSVPDWAVRGVGKGILTDEEKLILRNFADSIGKMDELKDLFTSDLNNAAAAAANAATAAAEAAKAAKAAGQTPPQAFVQGGSGVAVHAIGGGLGHPLGPGYMINATGGTFGFGSTSSNAEKDEGKGKGKGMKKKVHFPDDDWLPLESPTAPDGSPDGSPEGSKVRAGEKPPDSAATTPSLTVSVPEDKDGGPAPGQYRVPSPSSSSSSDDGSDSYNTPETPRNQQDPPISPPGSASSLPSVSSPNQGWDDLEIAIGSFLVFMVGSVSTADGDGMRITHPMSEKDAEARIREFIKYIESFPSKDKGKFTLREVEDKIKNLLESRGVIANTNADPAVDTEEGVRRELALSMRVYLGRRHDEYSVALSALSTARAVTVSDEGEGHGDETEARDDKPLSLSHRSLIPIVRQRNADGARDLQTTALGHWAGVTRNKRRERQRGYTKLRAIMKWANENGKVPLSPSSIRASTGLRRALFEPLGAPDLSLLLPPPPPPPPPRRELLPPEPGAYREATLDRLADLQPRLDLTLRGFLFNQDALRLFGGLVGQRPRPRDLGRMDNLLRELVSCFLKNCVVWKYVYHIFCVVSLPLSVPKVIDTITGYSLSIL
jgi:hypothetical protein